MKYACEYALIIIKIYNKKIQNMDEWKNIYSGKFNRHQVWKCIILYQMY